jgi:hypothetical protein
MLPRIFSLLFLLVLLCSPAYAIAHDDFIPPNSHALAYFGLVDVTNSFLSSQLNLSYGLAQDALLEFTLMGDHTAILYTQNSFNHVGLNYHKKVLDWGWGNFAGIAGLGMLYNRTAGGTFAPNMGVKFVFPFSSDLKAIVPVVGTVFSDGVATDMSAGVAYRPKFLNGGELLAGFRMFGLVYSSGSTSSFTSSNYATLGYRIYY